VKDSAIAVIAKARAARSAQDEDRDRPVDENFVRLAAEDDPGEAAPAVRAHADQVARALAAGPDDFALDVVAFGEHGVEWHAACFSGAW
jgi:hypothetical protein